MQYLSPLLVLALIVASTSGLTPQSIAAPSDRTATARPSVEDLSPSQEMAPPPILHSIGPSVLNNATSFGVQLFGENFLPGAQLELSDAATGQLIQVLPTSLVSSGELTSQVPEGMEVPSGIERELVARVINPDGLISDPPIIGHCATDIADSPIACLTDANCPPDAGSCVNEVQRLTMFNDRVFLNPNSAAVVPAPHGLCDDGQLCQGTAACAGIGSGTCSPKLYVKPQQLDELLVFNTGTAAFVDQNPNTEGIQGIPVGDNPFHVEILDLGDGRSRAWVVNRFDDAVSIIDPATDTVVAQVAGADLGAAGLLRMETEIEFNRAGTRAYLSNQNLDVIQVLDIAGVHVDAPVLLGTVDVGVNPRGMATNAADTRLYVANIQTGDISVVDIAFGSATEHQVMATIAARATDNIIGGRADGWEACVIGGRAPRGLVYSDAHNVLFATSIDPQTGPRAGVDRVGGAIINPTVTVIDATTNRIVAHVALNGLDTNRPTCSDPELMALDDARNRLYVTCQGSGTIDVLDTAALVAGTAAEMAIVNLPLPTDLTVPTLELAPMTGGFGNKVCGGVTTNSENEQNTLYAKAVTFFPNPNLNADGSLSTALPLPGGRTGDAIRGAQLFGELGCQSCHPAPLFTLDQFRVFLPVGFSIQPTRMREVNTPVLIPLREKCQDANRPTGTDGSTGFGVPTLRGIWDTFPLLLSGAAGFEAVGSEPVFNEPCMAGSDGCCTQLESPINPGGIPVPEQHLELTSKDALRQMLPPPLAVAGSGHGTAIGLSSSELDALIAYLRSF